MSTNELLQSIGYPEIDSPTAVVPRESTELYNYARKNKVGSLYVRSLHDADEITATLSDQWRNRRDFQEQIRRTLNGLPATIPTDVEYAVVKSAYPWVDSKDVDILLFGAKLDEVESTLIDDGYEFCGRSPTSVDVTDPETGIQLDIQSDFSLQRVVYFDKQTVRDGVERRSPHGTGVPILERSDDLALIVIHSITEQMYLLKEFYAAVSALESFSRNQFERFLRIVSENNIGAACRAFFTITWELCNRVFSRTPPYLREIIERFGFSEREKEAFLSNELETPHKYTSATGIRTIVGKMQNSVFRRTLAAQIPRLARPATAYHIVSQIFTRREREHYVHDTSDMGDKEVQ